MSNPFGTTAMAQGYAAFRPPLHARIIERVRPHLPGRVARALDAGCGAGLSTAALQGIADYSIGIDPAASMLGGAAGIAPGAGFLAARAEALPIRSHAIDLITAAGSLNYTRLTPFFQEASRVLVPGGVIAVYDFTPGKSFRDSDILDRWFLSFVSRYPWPPGEAQQLDPERLARIDPTFPVYASEHFEIALVLTPGFYLEYMMTETNVAFALRQGEPESEARAWISNSLLPVWGGQPREVLFRGYWALMRAVEGL